MMHHQNRIEQAREIFVRFEGVVPQEVLRSFISALVHSDEPAVTIGRSQHPWDRIFVYADEPAGGDDMILLPLPHAIRWGRDKTALGVAKTFGELKKLDEDVYDEIVATLNDAAEWPDLEDFVESGECSIEPPDYPDEPDDVGEWDTHEKEREKMKAAYHEKARKEYEDCYSYGSRPPRDEDKFEKTDYDGWCFDYCPNAVGDANPKTEMHGLVPNSIEEEFATLADGVWDGPYVSYKIEDKEKIVAALEELGYVAVEDDFLIEAAYWGCGDMGMFWKRVEWYENLEEILVRED